MLLKKSNFVLDNKAEVCTDKVALLAQLVGLSAVS